MTGRHQRLDIMAAGSPHAREPYYDFLSLGLMTWCPALPSGDQASYANEAYLV